jgi:hypothetical protein
MDLGRRKHFYKRLRKNGISRVQYPFVIHGENWVEVLGSKGVQRGKGKDLDAAPSRIRTPIECTEVTKSFSYG